MSAPATPSVRRLTTVMTVVAGIAAALVAAALLWTSARLERSMDSVLHDLQTRATANDIERTLLLHHRVSNLYVLTGDRELAETRASLASEMRQMLERSERYRGTTDVERRHLAAISVQLTEYLADRERLEALGLSLEEVVRRGRPALGGSLKALESLRDVNEAQLQRANAEARRANRFASIAGVTAAGLLVLGGIALAVGVRRSMLRPMLALHAAMKRFRAGETERRVPEGGLREVSELAQGFNEMAESLARQREDQLTFLAGIAHDLRNPLAALKMGIHTLEREQARGRGDRVRARLDRQVDRLSRMVEDLLDASRIEAGRLEIRIEELDFRTVVEEMVSLYAPTSPDHQVTAELPAEPIMVQGDPLRVEQVVSNLLNNAIKFSPGGGTIAITVAADGDDAVLSVTDSGVGIPPEELSNIFLPFRRPRPDVAPGAGLGLSVVRRIVTAHGGSIEVDSTAGSGSTFRVRLRRAAWDRGASPEPTAKRRVSPERPRA